MTSSDLSAANVDKIAELFPGAVTEARDPDGNPVRAVDFDLLRQELSDHIVDGPQERYQLDWPGKRAAAFAANAPIAKTLRPLRDQSVNFDTTGNLFIEGDNLDALKLLQESYLGKVKLIYIDPPYNTGNDFVYDDDYATDAATYLHESSQVRDDGARLVANPQSSGRVHSNWLTMMFARLKLARGFLRDDGVLLVSINDAEAPRLRQLLDELFGEANFLGQFVWMKGKEGGNDNDGYGQHHEYIVAYARQVERAAATIQFDPKDTSRHRDTLPEENRVVPGSTIYRDGELFQLINLSKQKDYEVEIPLADGTTVTWPSYAPQATIDEYVRIGKVFVGSKGVPYVKSFLADEAGGTKPGTIIGSEWGTTKAGGIALRDLFGQNKVFSYPKPPKLIARLATISGVANDDIVMDFFAGSATTAQAVMELNAADGGARRFILVQVAEDLDKTLASVSGKAAQTVRNAIALADELGVPRTVAEISKERIRRAAKQIGSQPSLRPLDLGFRCLRVDTSNMRDVTLTPDETDQQALAGLEDSVKEGRTGEDLLFQVLLDWGLEITVPIAIEDVAGHRVFAVDDDALIACFDAEVGSELVRALAEREPLRVVFRDSAFASDDARINAEQIFKEVSPTTEVKAV